MTTQLDVLSGIIIVSFLCSRVTWAGVPAMLSRFSLALRKKLLERFVVNCTTSFGVNASALTWIEKYWNLQTENTFVAIHFVRLSHVPMQHCSQFLTMSRIVDLGKLDDSVTLSALVGHWLSRNATQYYYFEGRAIAFVSDSLINLKELDQLSQKLGSNLLAKTCEERKKELHLTPVKDWFKLLADFEKGAEVVDEDSFDDAMEHLKNKFPQATGLG
jgi:hypothetical protein